jgi:hypothetical protein
LLGWIRVGSVFDEPAEQLEQAFRLINENVMARLRHLDESSIGEFAHELAGGFCRKERAVTPSNQERWAVNIAEIWAWSGGKREPRGVEFVSIATIGLTPHGMTSDVRTERFGRVARFGQEAESLDRLLA